MIRVSLDSFEDCLDGAQVALLRRFIGDQQEVKGEGFVVWVGVEPGFAEALTMAALVDGDYSVAFMVKAAGVNEAMAAGVV